jgi:hypothetical protein
MQMNSEKTRSGQVKMRSSTSVCSKVGSPRSLAASLARALDIASQTKKPTRKTIMTIGTLSGLATILKKLGSRSERTKKPQPATRRMRPPRLVHSFFDHSIAANAAMTSENDQYG